MLIQFIKDIVTAYIDLIEDLVSAYGSLVEDVVDAIAESYPVKVILQDQRYIKERFDYAANPPQEHGCTEYLTGGISFSHQSSVALRRDCQFFNHGPEEFGYVFCAINPADTSCQGCIDYIPHPLSAMMTEPPLTVVGGQHYFTVFRTIYAQDYLAGAIARTGIDQWQAETEIDSREIYFLTNKTLYKAACACLGYSLKHQKFEVRGKSYYIFCAQTEGDVNS